MKRRAYDLLLSLICLSGVITGCNGQSTFGSQYLKLERVISLPGVKGRIDHLASNVEAQIIYVAALGNNSLEVVSLKQDKVVHSIRGLKEPQGVGYISKTNEIFVANGGNGVCYFYNADTFKKTGTVQLSSDADDVCYDATSEKIYVGYGDGGIAAIDVNTHLKVADVQLPAHPERFQLDKSLGKIFVNLPDAHSVGVIDLKQMELIHEWGTKALDANFPMALSILHHRLFIGYRNPAKLAVLDSRTGKLVTTLSMAGDADDMYYDEMTNRIYISGGSGYINVFQQQNVSAYKQIANIPTRSGARTSLWIPQLHLFLLAARASGRNDAQLLVFRAE